jgi:aminodeoxyfutalosine deaminase
LDIIYDPPRILLHLDAFVSHSSCFSQYTRRITLLGVTATPTSTLFRAAWVAPMDRPAFQDGAVVIANETIVDVGDAAALRQVHRDAEERDVGKAVLLPGLINAHVHLELSDLPVSAGSIWDGPLANWLIEIIKRSPRADDPGRVRRAVEIGVEQCLRFGVTSVGDISRQPALARPVLRDSPLNVISFGEIQAMAGRRHLFDARLASAADQTCESSRLRVGLSPHAPYSVE